MSMPLNILLAEPHDDTARAIARVLNQGGHAVTRTVTIAEARALCEMMPFHLVITERRLNDGEASELFREGGPCHRIPTLLVTIGDEPEQPWKTAGERNVEYLRKPVSVEALTGAISRATADVK
jgi:DNA-binding NtrC family response regulator